MIVGEAVPVSTTRLLSSHTEQIKSLNFPHNLWANIREFSEANPGPFPLLRVLGISVTQENSFEAVASPSPSLFSNAANLKEVRFHSNTGLRPSLIFPNLVSLDLYAKPFERFSALRLLGLLEASPMLRDVRMEIAANISLEDVPQGRVVVLPNVEEITLVVTIGRPGYEIAAHKSRPSARHTPLTYEDGVKDAIPGGLFPHPVLLNKIVRQYSVSPVEKATLETITTPPRGTLAFWSAGAALKLRFKTTSMYRILRPGCATPWVFGSSGRIDFPPPCDLRPYLGSFLNPLRQYNIVFPPIKELAITLSQKPRLSHDQRKAAIIGLAQSQYARGVPFYYVRRFAMEVGSWR
jgi:hypothetical protein